MSNNSKKRQLGCFQVTFKFYFFLSVLLLVTCMHAFKFAQRTLILEAFVDPGAYHVLLLNHFQALSGMQQAIITTQKCSSLKKITRWRPQNEQGFCAIAWVAFPPSLLMFHHENRPRGAHINLSAKVMLIREGCIEKGDMTDSSPSPARRCILKTLITSTWWERRNRSAFQFLKPKNHWSSTASL